MNSSYYKYCIVPQCKSTSIKTPNKLFVYVPNKPQIRRKWLKLARRDGINCLSTNTRMYFCQDHFDLPNDMQNYIEYHIMGKVSQVRMKPGCIPSKFECQEDRRKQTCGSSTEHSYILKKQKITSMTECLNKSTTPSSTLTDSNESLDFQIVKQNEPEKCEQKANKSVPVSLTHTFRNTAVQIKVKSKEQGLYLLGL